MLIILPNKIPLIPQQYPVKIVIINESKVKYLIAENKYKYEKTIPNNLQEYWIVVGNPRLLTNRIAKQ